MLLNVNRELLAKSQLEEDLVAALPEEGRQSRHENRCVLEESPNHRAILRDLVGEIESDSRARLLVPCPIRSPSLL
jgi:hypothetical protein